ncbi:MAG: hypothetical protein HXX81_04015, partial [Campylobacterales bacterium]|nr:hypothetical protein [Campylobacterales bacterium]
MDYIFFIYGLAFILLWSIVYQFSKSEVNIVNWKWLGYFGLIHGIQEWCDLLALSVGDSKLFTEFRLVLLFTSFIALFEFARISSSLIYSKTPSRLIYIPIIFIISLGFFGSLNDVNALIRLTLGFGGASLGAFILYQKSKDFPTYKKYLQKIALVLFLYGIFGGTITPETTFLQNILISHQEFLDTFNFPVQLIRAISATTVAILVWLLWYKIYFEKSRPPLKQTTQNIIQNHIHSYFIKIYNSTNKIHPQTES